LTRVLLSSKSGRGRMKQVPDFYCRKACSTYMSLKIQK
jgi:hypothetical protein